GQTGPRVARCTPLAGLSARLEFQLVERRRPGRSILISVHGWRPPLTSRCSLSGGPPRAPPAL
ncbi:hypothetical protein HPB47_000371, partial [Ixodes persulcatus]